MIAARAVLMMVMAAAAVIIADVAFGFDSCGIQLGSNLLANRRQIDFVKLFLLSLFSRGQTLAFLFTGQFVDAVYQFLSYHFLHLFYQYTIGLL